MCARNRGEGAGAADVAAEVWAQKIGGITLQATFSVKPPGRFTKLMLLLAAAARAGASSRNAIELAPEKKHRYGGDVGTRMAWIRMPVGQTYAPAELGAAASGSNTGEAQAMVFTMAT